MTYNDEVRAEIGLIGRDDELAALTRFLGVAGPGALAIRGEPGVGKTALIGELCHRAEADGWRVLRAIGVEAERPFTLGGLNQMVWGLRASLARLDAPSRDALAPVLGADPGRPPSPMPLAIALLDLLSVTAAEREVLLVVDDAQWLDEMSAAVLSAAGRRASDPRVRIVTTQRPHSGAEFSTAGWTELTLGPLEAADAASIVDRLNPSLSAGTRQTILDSAEGNPLALQELPRHADQIDAWSTDATGLPLTERLVTVFGGRLRQLDARVRTELLRAALDGARANTSTDSGSRYAMVDVQTGIDQALLTVDPLGVVVFRHPLVRAAVIHQASAAERRDAHAHLAGLYGDVLVRRAAHLSAATTGPDQSVADLLDDAARMSIRRGGAAVAVDWLRRAAELSTVPARRDALRGEAAFVAAQASRFDDAQAIADEAESVSSVLAGSYLALYRDGEVLDTHRRILLAIKAAEGLDDATMSRLVKLLLAITQYAADPALWQQTDDAVDRVADRIDSAALLYRDAWGDLARRGHTVRARLLEHRDALSALEPWEVMRLGVTAYYVDGLADFRVTLTRLFERERDRGAVTNAMTMLHLLLLDQIACGRWHAARESARLGAELTAAHHNELFRLQFVAYDGLRAASAGDVDTARRLAAEVTGWAGPRRIGLLLGFARRITVLVALAEADYDAAYAAAVRIGPAGEFPPYAHQAVAGILDMVEAAVHSGRLDEARAHTDAAGRLRLAENSPRLDALITAARAMTAADEDAGPLYETALAHPAFVDFPFEHNRIRLAYGAWSRRRRRPTVAREALQLATAGFDALGAAPWAHRARAELRAAGATVKRSGGGTVVLTAQERKIAELAAAGHSNKQIAAQLYLSPRTVGAHLYRIFPKLGVTSRAGLGQAMRELGGP
ncbi:LuxR family transcriptional regulator [Mycobacterium antarcticum]|uniref:helix-turn-helix transcriptional regulator n=1 Tax=unclassified Mycolicibacterium TaxID=2636767 RepID=UPI00239AA926|nr:MULTISPECIES: LuxR family transcriptional regulator [unclassified Mycolicibacterium]BDX29638.1 LuxR family transcriptional regulator [Mycolicibacterium sp. TUM20985]GLP73069.1 LuxR family transcriptional regulator [Mycolicibacterium sp. TUM20983]GLP78784.1 LuxR family transcriptional regulator [Mycolicibacterium sp. TUM20984]